MPVNVRVEGVEAIVKALDTLTRELAVFADGLRALEGPALAAARRNTPIRTGRLRRTLRTERTAGRLAVVAGNRQVSYAPYVAYGTEDTRASPFVPRVDAVFRSRARREIERDIDRTIKQTGLN